MPVKGIILVWVSYYLIFGVIFFLGRERLVSSFVYDAHLKMWGAKIFPRWDLLIEEETNAGIVKKHIHGNSTIKSGRRAFLHTFFTIWPFLCIKYNDLVSRLFVHQRHLLAGCSGTLCFLFFDPKVPLPPHVAVRRCCTSGRVAK